MTNEEKQLIQDYAVEIAKVVVGKRPAIKKQEKILKKLGFNEDEIELLLFS